jgi:hypothetical protein
MLLKKYYFLFCSTNRLNEHLKKKKGKPLWRYIDACRRRI